MYRHQMRQQVLYGHFREFLETCEELNAVTRARGWRESSFWVPTIGTANEIIIEAEYPDLATFEKENRAFYSDPECMKLVRRLAELVAQGTVRDEILEPAPHLA